jgi:hypothetical protein
MITIFIKIIITALLAILINAIATGILLSYDIMSTSEEKLPPIWIFISFTYGFLGALSHFPGFKFTWEGINFSVKRNKKNFEKPLDNQPKV